MLHLNAKQHSEEELLAAALKTLRSGGLLVFPTETAYGVGALATNAQAVDKLLQYKRRPPGKAISVAVATKEMAESYVELNSEAEDLYKKFLPGPLTVISKSRGRADKRLESELGTLGIRIPDHSFVLKLLQQAGEGFTATSANSAGKKTPYSIDDIFSNISERQKQQLDLVLDFGELPKRPTSTVVDTTTHDLQIIRPGAVSLTDGINIESSEAMQRQGAEFAEKSALNAESSVTVVMFNAELGGGKTQFVKGMAAALGITETVKSPTYSLIEVYNFGNTGVRELVHVDAWRMSTLNELSDLEIENYFRPGNIIAIEWAGAADEYIESITKKVSESGSEVKVYLVDIVYTSLQTRSLRISRRENLA